MEPKMGRGPALVLSITGGGGIVLERPSLHLFRIVFYNFLVKLFFPSCSHSLFCFHFLVFFSYSYVFLPYSHSSVTSYPLPLIRRNLPHGRGPLTSLVSMTLADPELQRPLLFGYCQHYAHYTEMQAGGMRALVVCWTLVRHRQAA